MGFNSGFKGLTAIGLTPGGSSTVHTGTQTIQYIEQHNSLIRKTADRVPSCEVYPDICLTTEEKARKSLTQGSRRMLVGKVHTEHWVEPDHGGN
jgi:hypothetical protein